VTASRRNDLVKPGRKLAYQQIGISIFLVVACALVTYFCWGLSYAISALTGGAIGIIPNFIFAWKAFRYSGGSVSKLVVESFYSGVKLKLVLTALLFALAFKFMAILPVPFFGTFCLVMAIPLLAPVFLKN